MIAEWFRERYGRDPEVIASAPGRINLIGEHTDYNDGFVLPMAIDRRLRVAAAPNADNTMRVQSRDVPASDTAATARLLAYVNAVALELGRQYPSLKSADLYIASDIPMASGLSSSAALEVACARALCALSGAPWEPKAIARIAQRAENNHLGVRSGIMDQLASAAGRRATTMLIDCRSLDVSYAPLPDSVAFVVMYTGVQRAVVDTAYNDRRDACDTAVRALQAIKPDVKALRDATPALLNAVSSTLSPEVLQRARHIVEENDRPALLQRALESGDFRVAGTLMNASHASLRDHYAVSSPHLDLACSSARAHPACYGARMTGAGFGGCAIALVEAGAVDNFIQFAQPLYEASSYRKGSFFAVRADEGAQLEPLP